AMTMKGLALRLVITGTVGSLLCSNPTAAQIPPPAKKAARVEITNGPEVELSKSFLTIIRWTTNNPGGSDVHYGVVHYGTDPKELSQTAKNPIRLNQSHPETTFRVQMRSLDMALHVGSLVCRGSSGVFRGRCAARSARCRSAGERDRVRRPLRGVPRCGHHRVGRGIGSGLQRQGTAWCESPPPPHSPPAPARILLISARVPSFPWGLYAEHTWTRQHGNSVPGGGWA